MTKKSSLLILLFCLTACKDKIILQRVECYPQEEVCNGLDDDCDELIDEDSFVDCSNACGSGVMTCSKGKLSACSVREPTSPDVCDGTDNDCDGQIDEDSEVNACYPRDNSELLHGECRFGINRCVYKQYSCTGWVGPKAEECNGKDDNCNGAIDEDVSKSLDIVLLLDNSCSMADKTDQLINVTIQWVTKYSSRANLRFALVTAPSSNLNSDGEVTLEKNFSNVQNFITVLQTQQSVNNGMEATIDAIYDISTSSNPLGLTWSPGANKVIVVYSDEDPQSWRNPRLTELQAFNETTTNNVSVHVFTDSYILWSWRSWNVQTFSQNTILEKALDDIISSNSCK